MKSKAKTVSFELFPPKSDIGLENLKTSVLLLNKANPSYFSVTHGAGGSLQNPTQHTVSLLKKECKVNVVPHLSCIGATKSLVKETIDNYLSMNVKELVVLRGDLPSGSGNFDGDFRYAADLVTFIRQELKAPLKLKVAAYPECHPQAKHLQQDMEHFKRKVDAGADAAITQYFYNIDAYCHFVDHCRKLRIETPVIPGIMPITNLDRLRRFSKMCGAEIPQWIIRRLEGFADDQKAIEAFGIEVVSKLCERLLEEGAPELHFYTLNKAEPTLAILDNLSLVGDNYAAA